MVLMLSRQFIKEGKIVPVDVTVRLLLKAMDASSRTRFLIDGFPRNRDNLEGWYRIVGSKAEVFGSFIVVYPGVRC